jgi:hypothetical protein
MNNLKYNLQILIFILTLISSIFLSLGSLGLTPSTIAMSSLTMWGYKTEVLESLSNQKAYASIGYFLVSISFVLQIIVLNFKQNENVHKIHKIVKVLYFLIAIFVFVVCWDISKYMSMKTYRQAKRIVNNIILADGNKSRN